MTTFNLIVPTIAETELTGFIGAVEKTYRGALYRVEFYSSGLAPFKDGQKLRRWDDVPVSVQKAATAGRETLQQGGR